MCYINFVVLVYNECISQIEEKFKLVILFYVIMDEIWSNYLLVNPHYTEYLYIWS